LKREEEKRGDLKNKEYYGQDPKLFEIEKKEKKVKRERGYLGRGIIESIDINYTTRYNIDIIVQLFFWCHQLPQK
jgi:hypothetical protein